MRSFSEEFQDLLQVVADAIRDREPVRPVESFAPARDADTVIHAKCASCHQFIPAPDVEPQPRITLAPDVEPQRAQSDPRRPDGAQYRVNFYKGDYETREDAANRDDAICYVSHHFNSGSPTANYAVVITANNAGQTTRNWARAYAQMVADEFGIKTGGDNGLMVGGYDGRGISALDDTRMPAMLLEPLFGSNPTHAAIIRSEGGRQRLAAILVTTIYRFFPKGGVVGFSVGHKYKTSNPADRGAAVSGGGWEAEYAEDVLLRAEQLLES